MGPPASFPALAVGWHPGLIPAAVEEGGAGRSGGGLTPNPITGISVAFGSAHNAEAPLWQDITRLGS